MPTPPPVPREPIGARIAFHRVRLGMTQQRLADRVAMSRAGLSHLESGLSTPSERTMSLLAGVFDLEPHELAAGTDYPVARAERLPLAVARHTSVDLALALLDRDLAWCTRLAEVAPASPWMIEVRDAWRQRLARLASTTVDPVERVRVDDARRRLALWDAERAAPGVS